MASGAAGKQAWQRGSQDAGRRRLFQILPRQEAADCRLHPNPDRSMHPRSLPIPQLRRTDYHNVRKAGSFIRRDSPECLRGAAFWPPASPPCGAAGATSRKSPRGTIAERRAPKSHSGQQETESASPSGSRDLWHSGYILLARKKSMHIYISFPIYIENSYICG